MENLSLYELVDAVKGEFLLGDPHFPVSSVSIDTRTLSKHDFYFAIKGKNYDGHEFLKPAIEKGVKGLVVSRTDVDFGKPFPYIPAIVKVNDTVKALGDLASYYRKRFNTNVVGITGSNGKTTVKEMLSSILEKKGPTLKNAGNFNNQLGLPLTLLKITSQHSYAVIEMGTSFFGEIKRLGEITSPKVGIITNIGLAHLENFKDLDGVLTEKRALFDSLSSDGWAVVNKDDQYLSAIDTSLKSNIITFSIDKGTNVHAKNLKLWPGNPKFDLHIYGKSINVELPVLGKFNVYNALAAAAGAAALGVEIELIKEGLEQYTPPSMRMNIKNMLSGITVINDAYNSNPSSMRESINSVIQSFPDRNKVIVLGDMLELGQKAKMEHNVLGEFLSTQPLSQILLYGPLMENTFLSVDSKNAKYFKDKEDLVEELKKYTASNSVIFFKGSRGMKLEEIINKVFTD